MTGPTDLRAGFVVNDQDDLTDIEELVRLKEILDLKFQLIGKQVVTEGKQKLGKVTDYTFEKMAHSFKNCTLANHW